MDLRATRSCLSFSNAVGLWRPWRLPNAAGQYTTTTSCSRVRFPVCRMKVDVNSLDAKTLHHMRKKEDWKRKRRARKLQKLAELAAAQAVAAAAAAAATEPKPKLSKTAQKWQRAALKPAVEERILLVNKFNEEFARRVKEAVVVDAAEVGGGLNGEEPRAPHAVGHRKPGIWSSNLLQGLGRASGNGSLACGQSAEDLSAEEHAHRERLDQASAVVVISAEEEPHALRSVGDRLGFGVNSGSLGQASGEEDFQLPDSGIITSQCSLNDTARDNTVAECELDVARAQQSDDDDDHHHYQSGRRRTTACDERRSQGAAKDLSYDREYMVEEETSERNIFQNTAAWRPPPVVLRKEDDEKVTLPRMRKKDKEIARQIIARRRGEPLSKILDVKADQLSPEAHSILRIVQDDVDTEVYLKPVDEEEQLIWLTNKLNDIGKMRQIFLSRLMHSARLKWTEGRLLRLVQLLGDKGNWRRAIQVVHWVHCREHFKHCKSRHVYTTLLDVLGKCWRPVEALNLFNVMREDFSTYPDMAAYHSIAVTLGQAGHLTELLGLIEALQVRPKKDSIKGTRRRFDWNGLLYPDIVVYNAVINACGPHHQWQGAMWAMQQMQARGIAPNSASFGLSIEVMVKSGQVGSAWKLYERMERGGFLPNALTFKALVEALGKAGEADKAVEMVKDMRQRGFVDCAGVYYALACTLCTVGRWSEALLQVERLEMLSSKKPAVVTYTGLIRACEKAGHWNGAIAIFRQMQYVCTPNVGTCNIMISLYGRHRMFEDALEIFEGVKKGRLARKKMYEEGACSLTPDEFTYESILGACTVCEQWVYFHEVFQQMVRNGFGLHCQRHSWMIAPLLKAGQMHIVKQMVGCLKNTDGTPNVNVYRVLLASCCTLGQHGEVVSYLNDLLQQGVAVSSEEWATIFRAALEKLPVADVENFKSTLTKSDNTYGDMVFKDILNTHSSCEGQFSMNTA